MLTFRYRSWQDARDTLEAHGMMVVAKERMPADQYDGMFEEIRRTMAAANAGAGDALHVDAEYLEVLVTKP